MRQLLRLFALAVALLVSSTCWAIEGGTKDPITGLVWSPSQTALNGSTLTWKSSVNYAANYVNSDVNAQGIQTTYSDWRMPTLAEMITALDNGTIQAANKVYGFKAPAEATTVKYFWTLDGRGAKASVVGITFDDQGNIVSYTSILMSKKEVINGAFMVRP
jgi:hypothetical protein